MKARGFIAVDRSIFDHPIFRRRPDRLAAWEWLIASAAWKPEGRRGDFGVVHLERGQLPASLRSLGRMWGWPKSNVDCFLKRLVREKMICVEKTRTATRTVTGTPLAYEISIITICNYEKFQKASTASRRRSGQQPGHQPGQAQQKSFAFIGPVAPQQLNNPTKEQGGVGKGEGKGRERSKPQHGARGRGDTIWCDYGTSEWDVYAADYKTVTGAEPLPQDRIGGRGRWFKANGEAAKPMSRRASATRDQLEALIRQRRKSA